MVSCSAYGCKRRTERNEPGITFHRFPLKDPVRKQIWIENIHRAKWCPTKHSRICSEHFEKHHFYKIDNKVYLLDEAVPTIFKELPKYLQANMSTIRRPTERKLVSPASHASTSAVQLRKKSRESSRKQHLKRRIQQVIEKSKCKSQKIRVLEEKIKHYQNTVISIKSVIKELKVGNLLHSENSLIFDSLPSISKELY